MEVSTPWLKLKANGVVSVKDANGTWQSLIDPASMSISVYDLDSGEGAGRNQDGEMLRDRVAVKEKIEMSFPPMYRKDYGKMLALIKSEFFEVKYYSDFYGAVRTATMYVGDRSQSLYNLYDVAKEGEAICTGIKFNFIEK